MNTDSATKQHVILRIPRQLCCPCTSLLRRGVIPTQSVRISRVSVSMRAARVFVGAICAVQHKFDLSLDEI